MGNRVKLLIIADDLTGALDTGVQFSKKNIPVYVTTDVDIDFNKVQQEILCVDTETRHLSADDAYIKVYNLVKKATVSGIQHFYKKTDSTLRGNIGSELKALIDGSNYNRLMFVPAYPSTKRTTTNGIQYLNDVPIAQTHIADDPLNPITVSFIPDIIKQQASVNTYLVKPNEKPDHGCGIFIFDATSVENMNSIGKTFESSGDTHLIAGCAGFAEILTDIFSFEKHPTEKTFTRSNVLLVSGSLNPTSINQIKTAKEAGFRGVTLTPEQMLSEKYLKSSDGAMLTQTLKNLLDKDSYAYLETSCDDCDATEILRCAKEYALDINKISEQITKNLGIYVKAVVDTGGVDCLYVFGGDTLLGIMNHLNIKDIIPVFEIESGIVVSRVISDNYSFNLISKSGGFGSINAAIFK